MAGARVSGAQGPHRSGSQPPLLEKRTALRQLQVNNRKRSLICWFITPSLPPASLPPSDYPAAPGTFAV